MTIVRLATASDIDDVVAVHHETWHAAYKGVMTEERMQEGTPQFFRSRWEPVFGEHDPPLRSIIVAEQDHKLIGVLRLWPDEHREGRAILSYCHVLPSHQGKGIGSKMVDNTMRIAAESYSEIALWVVSIHDEARRFWCRQGWIETGRIQTTTGKAWTFDEVEYVRHPQLMTV